MELPKLKPGDEIRVVAPSRSASILSEEVVSAAKQRLESMGFHVTFGSHAFERGFLDSPSIPARVEDLHEAFLDRNVKGILTAIGGFTAVALLKHLDFGRISRHPKVFCGYSDITVLNLSLLAAGLGNYYGPHFSSFGMKKGADYMVEHFLKAVHGRDEFEMKPSDFWSDDEWYREQENRVFKRNEGLWTMIEGNAKGRIVAGNLDTLRLLQGTPYFPDISGSILFIEDDELADAGQFLRQLQGLAYHPDFSKVRGIVIGRFHSRSGITREALSKILFAAGIDIPVIANADFGHTMPIATIPLGGRARIEDSRIFIKP